jgi:chemotaxis protein histidine kinase CheA
VKYLVEALDGQVHVESVPGKGTKVTFTTPIFTSQVIEGAELEHLPDKLLRTVESN